MHPESITFSYGYEVPYLSRSLKGAQTIRLRDSTIWSQQRHAMDLRVFRSRLSSWDRLQLGIYNYGNVIRRNMLCLEIVGQIAFAYSMVAFESGRYFDLVDHFVLIERTVHESFELDDYGRFITHGNLVQHTARVDQPVDTEGSNFPNNDMQLSHANISNWYRQPNCRLHIVGRKSQARLFVVNIREIPTDTELLYNQPNPWYENEQRSIGDVDHRGWLSMSDVDRGVWLRMHASHAIHSHSRIHLVGLFLLDLIRHDLRVPHHAKSNVFHHFAGSFVNSIDNQNVTDTENPVIELWERPAIRRNKFFQKIRDIHDETIARFLVNPPTYRATEVIREVLARPFGVAWWQLYINVECDLEENDPIYNQPFMTSVFGDPRYIDTDAHPYGYDSGLLFVLADDHAYECTCRGCRTNRGPPPVELDSDHTDDPADAVILQAGGWGEAANDYSD